MRAGLDATPLTAVSGGIRRYTESLALHLAGQYPDDSFLLLSDQQFPSPAGAPANLQSRFYPEYRRWWLRGLPREIRNNRLELFHGTDFSVPYIRTAPSVLTLHDLSPWRADGGHSGAGRVRSRTRWLLRLRRYTMVVTPTEAIRREAIAYFGLRPDRVRTTPLAAEDCFRPGQEDPPPRPFFLYAGTLEPRKNIDLLVEAWRRVRAQCDVGLVLAGRRREDCPAIPTEPGLRWVDTPGDGELARLYRQALALVYPSRYEGFGLPVVEAMQSGLPVLISPDPALREVAGAAGWVIDTEDSGAWAAALTRLWKEPDQRRRLTEAALLRAKVFSWKETARLTREVYVEALARYAR